jgi:hypothetical protein
VIILKTMLEATVIDNQELSQLIQQATSKREAYNPSPRRSAKSNLVKFGNVSSINRN